MTRSNGSETTPLPTIDPSAGLVTFVNVFSVEPERAEELVEVLSRATEEVIRHLPGFVSANLHVSEDRRRVLNYAQWRRRADHEAMLKDPKSQVHLGEAAKVANSFDAAFYELRHSHVPGGPR